MFDCLSTINEDGGFQDKNDHIAVCICPDHGLKEFSPQCPELFPNQALIGLLLLVVTFMHVHEERRGIDIPINKFESSSAHKGSKVGSTGTGYEVSRVNRRGAFGQAEQRLMELRLRWALRRIRDRFVIPLQRRCELKQFVVLRIQYLYRRRNRVRAAITIQKFIRNRILVD
jgi:hypothetical protein